MQAEFIWTIISFVLTIMILSYVFGDNPLLKLHRIYWLESQQDISL